MSVVSESNVPPLTDRDRQWAAMAHASALLGAMLSSSWLGCGCVVGPLLIWLIQRDRLPWAAEQAREAFNFNLTLVLVAVSLILFSLVTFGIGLFVAVPTAIVIGTAWLVLTVLATIKAYDGQAYRYPWTLRLL